MAKKMKKEGKTRGTSPQTGSLSDHAIQLSPDMSRGRGIGSSFAYAVGAIMQQAPAIKGSQTDFLGEPSETVDIKEMSKLVTGK